MEIMRGRKLLAVCPPDDPQRMDVSWDRMAVSWDQMEIMRGRKLLAGCPPDDPQRMDVCRDLVHSLYQRYKETGITALLEEVITLEREVLALPPAGHPDRAIACNNLAITLAGRYKVTGVTALLVEAITLHRDVCWDLVDSLDQQYEETGNTALLEEMTFWEREVLALRPAEHPGRANACYNLAVTLARRYDVTGESDILDWAITLHREALALRPAGHPDRYMLYNNLANALQDCYEMTGVIALLDETITLRREALFLTPAGHPDRVIPCSNLANALQDRYEVTGVTALLDEIITLHREALALRPAGHPDHASSCNNLASALIDRYEVAGATALLDEAITLHREALSLRPAGHPDHASSCNNLAAALKTRYGMTGSGDLLDETITLYRETLALYHAGHTFRAGVCINLASALQYRYDVTGTTALLDEATTLLREALALRPAGHPDHSRSCNNLANALCTRYEVTGSSDLLDETITLHREALSLRPTGHPDRANSCGNLALALCRRYEVTGTTILLDEVIALHREALSLRPVEHSLRATSCNNLANALQTRYNMTGSSDLLDETITLDREALSLRPVGHPDRARSCNNLATALFARYELTGITALLGEAITLYREDLFLTPAEHPYRASSCYNLAAQLLRYFRKTRDVTAIDEALMLASESAASASPSFLWRSLTTLCDICTEQGSPHVSISTATGYLSQASALHPDNITEFMQRMQDRLAIIWSMQSTWNTDLPLLLLSTYSNLIDLLSRMTGYVLDIPSQLMALKSARSFGSDACIAALLSNHSRQAMELVDHAHGVIWAQALHQRDPQLQQLPQGLASELRMLLRVVSVPVIASGHETLEQRVPGFLSPQDIRHEQNSRIQTLLTEIREMPGLDRFMLGHTYAELRKTANKHPVVVLVAARGQAYALIISDSKADSPHPLALPITSDTLSSLRDYAGRAGLRNGQSPHHIDDDARLGLAKPVEKDASMTVLSELWLHVVKPVLDYLQLQFVGGRSRRRLYWCPTGDFGCLPLHAAGIYHGPSTKRVCCADYVVSSYTPTLSALLRAQTKTPLIAPGCINMLAFGEDCSSSSTMSTLHNIDREMGHIRAATQTSRASCTVETIASAATVERVTDRIQSVDFVHLACHGTQDLDNALESGFHLSDGKLTVSKLMNLDLDKGWFAYLSACETAKGDEEQPDQVVHLAAAMLHAGFKSVVATMWSMSDIDGPDMAKWFYEELLSNEVIDADAVAYALDVAVGKLRKKIPLLPKRWAPYIHMGA